MVGNKGLCKNISGKDLQGYRRSVRYIDIDYIRGSGDKFLLVRCVK